MSDELVWYWYPSPEKQHGPGGLPFPSFSVVSVERCQGYVASTQAPPESTEVLAGSFFLKNSREPIPKMMEWIYPTSFFLGDMEYLAMIQQFKGLLMGSF